jgi:hypothetical protein
VNLELPNLADTLKFDGLSSSFKDVLDLYEENVLRIFMDVEDTGSGLQEFYIDTYTSEH